jgi:hypothetical protein
MGGYTRAISGQRSGKQVPAETELCSLCGPCLDVVSKGKVIPSQFYAGVCEEISARVPRIFHQCHWFSDRVKQPSSHRVCPSVRIFYSTREPPDGFRRNFI